MASDKKTQEVGTGFVVRNSHETISDEVHNRLLENIKEIHGQSKITPAVRNEPAAEISEFSFQPKRKSNRGKTVFREEDLIRAIKKKQPKIAQKLETSKKNKTLPKPFETVYEKKFQREAGFHNLKKRLNRWSDVVQSNRIADQLRFPLNSRKIEVYNHIDCDLFSSSGNPTPLEIEMNKVLKTSETAKENQEQIEQSRFRLTLKEMIEKRKTMAKVKAQASYKIAKAARQNKIKSKKYHRILRREKIKKQMKDFEMLQKSDPEAALKQLQNMEKARAEERATLRHRNTGKWAHNQMVKAKYNKESRIALSEQLSYNRELTQKRHEADSDNDSLDTKTDATSKKIVNCSDNPWLEDSNEYVEFVTNYKKFWEEDQVEKTGVRHVGVKDDGHVNTVDKINSTLHPTTSQHTATSSEVEPSNTISTPNNEEHAVHNFNEAVISNDTVFSHTLPNTTNKKKCISQEENDELKVNISNKNKRKIRSKKENSAKKKPKIVADIINSSGSWTVTEISANEGVPHEHKTSNPAADITDMFQSLEETLQQKLKRNLGEIQRDRSAEKMQSVAKKNKMKKSKFKNQNIANTVDVQPSEGAIANKILNEKSHVNTMESANKINSLPDDNIDPNKYLKVAPKHLATGIPDVTNTGDEGLDDEEEDENLQYRMTIGEAFAEDDVVAEFQEEKKKAEADSQPNVKSLSLPGWGAWADSKTIQEAPKTRKFKRSRTNKRLLFRTPKAPPRKDSNKGHVIINEDKSIKMKEHLVNELPYPFTQVKDFEASIRAPIGTTWLPETAHQQLIAPPVVTKLGAVIEPMDEGELLERED